MSRMLNRSLYRIFALALFGFSFTALAAEEGRWVTVEGMAAMDAGKKVAEKQALLEAYRRAINEGGSVEISELSSIRNFAAVTDIITKRSHGFIKQYSVIGQGVSEADPETYVVQIKAYVVDKLQSDQDSESGLRQYVQLIGSPTVLFVLGAEDGAELAQDAENALAAYFRNVGYEVRLSSDLGRDDQALLATARQGDAVAASMLGRNANVDVVVFGNLDMDVRPMDGGTDIEANLATVTMRARAMLPNTGQVLHVTNANDRFMGLMDGSATTAAQRSIDKVSKKAAKDLSWAIPKVLSEESLFIDLTLQHASYDEADAVREYLSGVTGVDKVELKNWSSDAAQLSVEVIFTGPREFDLMQALRTRYPDLKPVELSYYRLVAAIPS